MEKKCIYCGTSENLTISDIIPSSMTEKKLTNKNVCAKHNNLTNDEFESEFAENFAFFRNILGMETRSGHKLVKFDAEITVNGQTLFKNYQFTSIRNFFKKHIQFDDDKNYHLKNVPPSFTAIKNPDISYFHRTEWANLYLSDITLKTIAKISYEYHCKNNNINDKLSRYQNIINYILQEKSFYNPVQIVDDDIFETEIIKSFGYVDGAHALFEYVENGKRYVICSIFGDVWYKTYICDDFDSQYEKLIMSQFLLDGTLIKRESNLTQWEYDIKSKKFELIEKDDFTIYAVDNNLITDPDEFLKRRVKILNGIVSSAVVTIEQLKRYKELLIKIKYKNLSKQEIYSIGFYSENIKIISLLSFYAISNITGSYQLEIDFLNAYLAEYLKLKELNLEQLLLDDTFLSRIETGILKFDDFLNRKV